MGKMSQHSFQILWYIGRFIAFVVGMLAFYIAIFLYEREEEALQNRLENLWIQIDERAKLTDSATTAILNQVANLVSKVLSYVFGPKMLSLQTLVVSANLSMCVYAAFYWYLDLSPPYPYICAAEVALCLLCARLAMQHRMLWALAMTVISISVFGRFIVLTIEGSPNLQEAGALLAWSLGADIWGLVVLRRVSRWMSGSRSLGKMIWSTIFLVIGLSLVCIPAVVAVAIRGQDTGEPYSTMFSYIAAWEVATALFDFAIMNVITALYLIVPLLILAILLAHRVLWPLLARSVHPLCRYKMLLDKKVMCSIGGLCFTFAFNLETIGAKEILKLIGK